MNTFLIQIETEDKDITKEKLEKAFESNRYKHKVCAGAGNDSNDESKSQKVKERLQLNDIQI